MHQKQIQRSPSQRKARTWATCLASVALLAGGVVPAQAAEKVTVFAAASLTNALQDIAAKYKQKNSVEVVMSFASSSTLARQIEQGAQADMFISADQQWMDYAIDKKQMVANTRYTLLGNNLVVIAAANSKLNTTVIDKKTDWTALLADGRLSVGDPDHVPAGIYAKDALQNLGAWSALASRLAPTSDVRSALALVEREEAPLGIVYGSDASASKKVKVIGVFPAASHKPVEYPMAIVKDHQNSQVSAFFNYLKSSEAAVIFKQYGFSPQQ